MSILIFIAVFSAIVIVHEFGHFIAAKKAGVRVEQFSVGFGPKVIGLKKGGTEYMLCAFPVGAYVKLAEGNPEESKFQPDEYLAKAVGQRARIIFFGPLFNYVLAFICFWFIFLWGFPALTCRVGKVMENYGAEEAGMQAQDNIIAVDGQKVEIWEELQEIVQKGSEDQTVTISVLRGNKELSIPVRIKQKEIDTIWGEKKTIGIIGIEPEGEITRIRYGPIKSFFQAGGRLLYFTWLTLKSLVWIILGRVSFRQSITGPLGVFFITKEAAYLGIVPLINVTALISMALAIFNLLPLPVLDGGNLLFLLIEKIRGRRLSSRTETMIIKVGYSLILLLTIFVFYNDLLRYEVFTRVSEWWSRFFR
ncbi:MAG: RIP metalloprotease RseP [Candidatus Omnitrophota bacterium]